jgi:hypothetical protein
MQLNNYLRVIFQSPRGQKLRIFFGFSMKLCLEICYDLFFWTTSQGSRSPIYIKKILILIFKYRSLTHKTMNQLKNRQVLLKLLGDILTAISNAIIKTEEKIIRLSISPTKE